MSLTAAALQIISTINICYVIHTPSGLGLGLEPCLGLVMPVLVNVPGVWHIWDNIRMCFDW